MTPLHMSVKKGYADIAGRLLQTGRVDLDQKVSRLLLSSSIMPHVDVSTG